MVISSPILLDIGCLRFVIVDSFISIFYKIAIIALYKFSFDTRIGHTSKG
ncbi:unnamed protein product [Camellia sinensis]